MSLESQSAMNRFLVGTERLLQCALRCLHLPLFDGLR